MKTIVPVSTWSNGQEIEANVLNSYVQGDNLKSQATFYYGIGTVSYTDLGVIFNALSSGMLIMTGQAYADYQTNQYAWDWVASQLNLTITGDVTTTTTTTSTTTEAPIVNNEII
jgi:hypothetical protein